MFLKNILGAIPQLVVLLLVFAGCASHSKTNKRSRGGPEKKEVSLRFGAGSQQAGDSFSEAEASISCESGASGRLTPSESFSAPEGDHCFAMLLSFKYEGDLYRRSEDSTADEVGSPILFQSVNNRIHQLLVELKAPLGTSTVGAIDYKYWEVDSQGGSLEVVY